MAEVKNSPTEFMIAVLSSIAHLRWICVEMMAMLSDDSMKAKECMLDVCYKWPSKILEVPQ